MRARKRTSLFFDVELVEGLKALKARDGIPEAEAVRRAVAAYLAEKGISVAGEKKTERKRAATRKRS
jgi:hypothetical protein